MYEIKFKITKILSKLMLLPSVQEKIKILFHYKFKLGSSTLKAILYSKVQHWDMNAYK